MDKRIMKNISWLVVDSTVIIVLQLFVGVKTANYFGTETYGIYSYAMAIVGFTPIFLEIMNRRIIKEHYVNKFNETVNVVTSFRNIICFVLFLIGIFSYPVFKGQKLLYILINLLLLDNIITSQTMGIENYFEYKLDSKKIVISNNIVKVLSYLIQYLGLSIGLNILMMPIIRVLGSLLRMCILKLQYKREYFSKVTFELNFDLIMKIIKDSYYLWISYIALVIYTQFDKIMIGSLLGNEQVAIYSVALQLVGILAILIGPFQNSVYPKMMKLVSEDYSKYYSYYKTSNLIFTQVYLILILLSIPVVYFVFPKLYVHSYFPAINCYIILTISIFMKANGALQTGHMTLNKITKKSFYKTVCGLFLNLILNFVLIPKYGINGAAMATSITQLFTIFIIDIFIKEYREQFFIQLYSLNPFNLLKLKKEDFK